jgi:hypothetical protein
MPLVAQDELQEYARQRVPERHDSYSEKALATAYEEYLPRRTPPIARATLTANGTEYASVYQLLAEADSRIDSGTITLIDPPPAGPAWEFLTPFEKIALDTDGSAELYPLNPGQEPVRGILRFLLREHYVPRSSSEEQALAGGVAAPHLRTTLAPASLALDFVRTLGVVPFSIAALLYLPNERVRYEFDLLDMTLLPDPRAGRFAVARRVPRSSRVSFGVDSYVARSDLPQVSARLLEILVESHGLSSVELAHIFRGLRELVDSALQGLVARELAVYDRRTHLYRARMEAFLTASERTEMPALVAGPTSDPSLRTSVMELIAAAESRATCPLCGDPLPPGHRGILCDKCAAEVGAV